MLAVIAMTACWGAIGEQGPDGGFRPDSGQVNRDAGGVDAGRDAGGAFSELDASAPDGGRAEADAGMPQLPDSGEPDAGRLDAGSPDAAVIDGGAPDAGVADAGSVYFADAGTQCTGFVAPLVFDQTPTVIATCRTISAPGVYRLSTDLSATTGCLVISSTNSVKLDCGGHAIKATTPLDISNVERFEVTNCRFDISTGYGSVSITDAGTGFFHDNAIDGGMVNVWLGHNLHAYSNDFFSFWQQNNTVDTSVSCNSMVSPTNTSLITALIGSNSGHHNRFERNTIDGRWSQVRSPSVEYVGADDGIAFQDEHDDVMRTNTITRVFDTGIESLGAISKITIDDNDISIAGYYGIAGFYWSSVSGCTFTNNRIKQTEAAFFFYRTYGLRAASADHPADTAVFFNDNLFDSNVFSENVIANFPVLYAPVYSKMNFNGVLSSIPGERLPADTDYVMTNNVFRNNVFQPSAQPAVFGSPLTPGFIVDQGGNHCPADPGGPLTCSP